MVNKERLIERFIELVKIDSETKHEGAIATYLKDELTALDVEVEEDQAKEKTDHGANNLICTLKGTDPHSRTIFFSSHMDTVTPGKNVKPHRKDGYITSDGTTILGADDKAGIAVFFELIHILKEQNLPHGDIQFIITVGEEAGLNGAKALDRSLVKADFGYVLDSDGAVGNLVVRAPYQSKFHVTIYGKSAHAGVEPEKGISAITTAAKAISKMKLGRIDEETTANISYFKGGKKEATNIVTEYVEIEGEARSLEKKKLDDIIAHITNHFETTAEKFGAKTDLKLIEAYPGYKLQENEEVVQIAQQAAHNLQLTSELLTSGGGSDANIFNSFNLPTANLSVGYEEIHTTKERISEEELVRLTKLVVEIVKLAFK
ncbi:MAG TPA: M20/M25/M40 family metallo-hydrolase [Pseudogracilibacillus sp.]|nr:M20/M25/M40 family metallo-hydrolase [Pseudogracilibacillus sp.]